MTKPLNEKAVVEEAEAILTAHELPEFLPGGEAEMSVKVDGGDWKPVGRITMGDIRIGGKLIDPDAF